MKKTRREYEEIAQRRILSVLGTYGVANMRTLEQKISDAGPTPQRLDPHILTGVRNRLLREGRLRRIEAGNTNWFHLADTPPITVSYRLDMQLPIFLALSSRSIVQRVGQTLEIATFRALSQLSNAEFGYERSQPKGSPGTPGPC